VRACVRVLPRNVARTFSHWRDRETRQTDTVLPYAHAYALAICDPNSALGSKTQRSLSALRRFAEKPGEGGREDARRGRAMNHRAFDEAVIRKGGSEDGGASLSTAETRKTNRPRR